MTSADGGHSSLRNAGQRMSGGHVAGMIMRRECMTGRRSERGMTRQSLDLRIFDLWF